MDQVFAVRQVCEKYLTDGKYVFWAFVDLKKAYDTIGMAHAKSVGNWRKLLKAVQSYYVDCRACVRVGNDASGFRLMFD